jgi:hypothetical protein
VSDYHWFRLLLKAVGVLLLGLSIPKLLWTVGSLLVAQTGVQPGAGGWPLAAWLPSITGYGSQAAIGLYLLFGAQRLIEYGLRGVRGRCAGCGYSLTGLTADLCPECGTPIARPAPAPAKNE